jgi:hypothetical protein
MHQGTFSDEQAARFHRLGTNVPHDFRLVRNKVEELQASVDMLAKVEELQEFFGLDFDRMIKITRAAKQHLVDNPALVGGKKISAEVVATWLAQAIDWKDRKRAPGKDTVADLLKLGDFLSLSSPQSAELMTLARAEFGRGTLFDEVSKLVLIINRASCTQQARYALEFLYSRMKRQRVAIPDSYSKNQLKHKAGIMLARSKVFCSVSGVLEANAHQTITPPPIQYVFIEFGPEIYVGLGDLRMDFHTCLILSFLGFCGFLGDPWRKVNPLFR